MRRQSLQNDILIQRVRQQKQAGLPLEETLAMLRSENATKIDSIRILHLATGITLTDAKRVVFHSRTWHDRLGQDEAFLDAVVENLDELGLESTSVEGITGVTVS